MGSRLNFNRRIVKNILLKHAEKVPSHGDIEMLPVFDDARNSYLLLDLGWDNTGRIYSVLIHLSIKGDKIWVEVDGTEEGVTQGLLDAGISKKNIVLGFYRPKRRAITGFAIA